MATSKERRGGGGGLGRTGVGGIGHGKKSATANDQGDKEAHGILEGISSLHSWIKTQTMIRPHSKVRSKQGGTYDEDLDEDVVITLVAKDPQAPHNKIRYDHTTGTYITQKLVESMIDHLEIESSCVHKDSEEGKRQLKATEGTEDATDGFKSLSKRLVQNVKKEKLISMIHKSAEKVEDDEADDEEDDEDDFGKLAGLKRRDSSDSDSSRIGDNKLTNQFSFVERATQTMNNGKKDDEQQTEPPPRAKFSDTVTQFVIYDAYVTYEAEKEALEEQDRKGKSNEQNKYKRLLGETQVEPNDEANESLLKSARILERMVNQNTFNEIALDFKYWEDASDEFRETEGTLLPLWKFSFEKAKNLEITGLCWNPAFKDLFAASFGSYDFYEQEENLPGVVCVFSLKNPSYPEYLCSAHCGVLCVDIHPNHPHMLAVGLSDGNVAVYNLQKPTYKPTYISTANNGKHHDIVWQVKWAKDNLDGYLNFYSISGDGRVSNWTIVKTSLWYTDALNITFCRQLTNFPDIQTRKALRDGGRCIAFNPNDDTLFLVGTDEGIVYKCTTEYSSKFLMTYEAHNTPIYNICWNPFLPSIFLTCASEWIIKIWDHNSNKPLFMFDLNSQVGDIAWAPYSSTVFAAVTVDGKAHVFDINIDKYHSICTQQIVSRKKAKLNHVAFNTHHPIIIAGDSRGFVQCLKLSPNLRKKTKEIKNAILAKDRKKILKLEVKKLESIMAMVREPEDKVEDTENEEDK